jgi:hypothetical protein
MIPVSLKRLASTDERSQLHEVVEFRVDRRRCPSESQFLDVCTGERRSMMSSIRFGMAIGMTLSLFLCAI